MKYHLLSLVVSSVLLISLMGCEDNSMNNPVSGTSVDKVQPPGVNTLSGKIMLDHRVGDPVRINNYYQLTGNISYTQELFSVNNPNQDIVPGYNINLDIQVDAILKDYLSNLEPNSWEIKAESNDRFYINAAGSYTLIKAYPVVGTKDRLELVFTFIVTTDGMKLEGVILSSPVV